MAIPVGLVDVAALVVRLEPGQHIVDPLPVVAIIGICPPCGVDEDKAAPQNRERRINDQVFSVPQADIDDAVGEGADMNASAAARAAE